MKKKIFFIIFILFFSISCDKENEEYRNAIFSNPAKQIENYNYDFNSLLQSRIKNAPSVLIEYLEIMDERDNYYPYLLSDKKLKIVHEYLSYIPEEYINLLVERLIGIYFIGNYESGGMANYVFNEKEEIYYILIINPQLLENTLKEWIEYRDSSGFSSGSIKIKNNLGNDYLGLLYILIHETSHIYDYHNHITPYTDVSIRLLGFSNFQETTFTKGIWKAYAEPIEMYNFQFRNEVKSYSSNELIDNNLIYSIYNDLASTPFTSLYGSQNWAEDYAEFYTWFYIKNKFDIKYEVELIKNDNSIYKFSPLDNDLIKERYEKFSNIVE